MCAILAQPPHFKEVIYTPDSEDGKGRVKMGERWEGSAAKCRILRIF